MAYERLIDWDNLLLAHRFAARGKRGHDPAAGFERRLADHLVDLQQELADQYTMAWFPGDDLMAIQRPRGLPIGNLTSQFWSNCHLDELDHFVIRELRCRAYLRYVDDMALFSDSKQELWRWKTALVQRLAALRLTVHAHSAQVDRVDAGIPWLGFIIFPTHRRLKARNVVKFDQRLRARWADHCTGRITFAEFDASVRGWVNHVRYADTWGLRQHLLGRPLVGRPPVPPKPDGSGSTSPHT